MASATDKGLMPGTAFGKYTIVEHIGRGGMGDVYKAVQNGLDRPVALKVLPHLLARASEFSDRFNAEALAISRLQHQNIVTLYDYGEVDGQKYIAMQYIQGLTLNRMNQREKPLPFDRIISITKQICRGLKYAHANDIVHRDIKSGNIMMEAGDKVYISDFGIAKAVDAPSITTTGMALGTPEFMAPEQCEGGIVDGQSDLYGLGVILFELVAGKPPFLADTPLAVAYKQVHEQPPLLGKLRPEIPRRLELIVAKCLKKSRAERYQNADELLRDLDSVGQDMTPPPVSTTLPATPNQRITDRRGGNRRYGPGEENRRSFASRAMPAALGVILTGIVALQGYQIWATRKLPPAFGGLTPATLSGPSSQMQGEPALPPSAQVDGKRSTAWGLPAKSKATFAVDFNQTVLWTHLVIEGGWSAAGETEVLPPPRFLYVASEGMPPQRFTLRNTPAPQTLRLDLVGRRFELTWESPLAMASAIREWRAFGMNYEE